VAVQRESTAGPVAVTGRALAPYTTLGLGGPARSLLVARDRDELVSAVRAADDAGERLLVLGGGSNVVLADEGFDGTVVLIRTSGVDERAGTDGTVHLTVAAGEEWDGFVARAVAAGLAGLECLSGIPGSVGAGPIQNIGAYGQEVADTCMEVQVWDRRDAVVRLLAAQDCGFAYRTSVFKQDARYVVLAVTFALTRSGRSAPVRYAQLADALGLPIGADAPLAQVRETVLALRRGKGMVLDPDDPDCRSVGSFFLNPVLERPDFEELCRRAGTTPPHWPADGRVKVSAAWLVETGGFPRGYRRGAVAVSGKHSLALVHLGGGSTAELLALAGEIVDGVRDATGVTLHPEARIIPARAVTAS